MQRIGRGPLAGPISLRITAIWSLAKSHHKKKSAVPRQWKTSKPDASNVLKIIEDAFNGVVWLDDSQVAHVSFEKHTNAQGLGPGLLVQVEPLESQPDWPYDWDAKTQSWVKDPS